LPHPIEGFLPPQHTCSLAVLLFGSLHPSDVQEKRDQNSFFSQQDGVVLATTAFVALPFAAQQSISFELDVDAPSSTALRSYSRLAVLFRMIVQSVECSLLRSLGGQFFPFGPPFLLEGFFPGSQTPSGDVVLFFQCRMFLLASFWPPVPLPLAGSVRFDATRFTTFSSDRSAHPGSDDFRDEVAFVFSRAMYPLLTNDKLFSCAGSRVSLFFQLEVGAASGGSQSALCVFPSPPQAGSRRSHDGHAKSHGPFAPFSKQWSSSQPFGFLFVRHE